MNLNKTFFANGVGLGAKVISTLILNKLIATVGGPSAYVILGQLQNIYQLMVTAIFGGANVAITKHLADAGVDEHEKEQVVETSYRINFLLAVALTLFFSLSYVFSINNFLFTDENKILLLILAIVCLPLSFSTMYLAVFNGVRDIKSFVRSNIIQSLIIIIGALCFYKVIGTLGILAIFLIAQPLSLFYMHKRLPVQYRASYRIYRRFNIDWQIVKSRLGPYAAVSLVGVALIPLTLITVRHILVGSFSDSTVGYWEAAHRTSQLFMIPLTSILSIYFLPKFSSNKQLPFVVAVMSNSHLLVGYLLIGISLIFVFDDWVISTLYSSEFLPASTLLRAYVLGSALYFISMVIQYYLLAHSQYIIYVVFELVRSLGYILGVIISLRVGGAIEWVGYAYIVINSLVLCVSACYLRTYTVFEE